MTDWRSVLREWDAGEAPTDRERVREMRRRIVNAAEPPAPTALRWQVPLAVTAAAVFMLVAGASQYRQPEDPVLGGGAPGTTERRQIQFATPGGTRIIWELNPEFTLTETLP